MNPPPTPLSHIQHIDPYATGKSIDELARERNISPDAIIKLASNENPLGMSPVILKALYTQ